MASSEWATHNWDMVGNCESEESQKRKRELNANMKCLLKLH